MPGSSNNSTTHGIAVVWRAPGREVGASLPSALVSYKDCNTRGSISPDEIPSETRADDRAVPRGIRRRLVVRYTKLFQNDRLVHSLPGRGVVANPL